MHHSLFCVCWSQRWWFLADNETCIHVYGANYPSLVLTPYQQRMNTASQSLTSANPNLLNNRRKLMELQESKSMKTVMYISMERADQSKFAPSDTSTSSCPTVKQTQTGQNDYKELHMQKSVILQSKLA